MKTKTLSDKEQEMYNERYYYYRQDVKDFIKWCLDNNINQTGTTLVLPLNKFKEKLGDKLI